MDSGLDIMLGSVLSARGYKKKGKRWSKDIEKNQIPTFTLIELQRSNHAKGTYINCGVCFGDLLEKKDTYPPSHAWHINTRFENIAFTKNTDGLVDDETPSARLVEIVDNFNIKVLPYLIKISDINYLLEDYLPNFDWDTGVRIQNIRLKNLIQYLSSK